MKQLRAVSSCARRNKRITLVVPCLFVEFAPMPSIWPNAGTIKITLVRQTTHIRSQMCHAHTTFYRLLRRLDPTDKMWHFNACWHLSINELNFPWIHLIKLDFHDMNTSTLLADLKKFILLMWKCGWRPRHISNETNVFLNLYLDRLIAFKRFICAALLWRRQFLVADIAVLFIFNKHTHTRVNGRREKGKSQETSFR